MNKYLLYPTFFLALFFAATAWGGTPQVRIDKDSFNFGEIYKGEKVVHTFTFYNDGDAPLNITKVRSSCGCTAAVPSERVIPAGGTGELKATFDSGRFRGPISKTVYLYTDDPIREVVQLYIRGTVKEEVVVTPTVLNIGSVDPLSRWEGVVNISNEGKGAIELIETEATVKGMALDVVSNRILPGESTQIKVTQDVPEGTRNINGYIILKILGAHTDTLRIPVSGMLRHNVQR